MAERSTNTLPILALVAAEIGVLLSFVGACELRAREIELCEHRWSLVLPAVALAGQSAATYFMDNGRSGSSSPSAPRNARGQFMPRRRDEDHADPA
jgi:hypothetical protein